jgi:hypothetical protein
MPFYSSGDFLPVSLGIETTNGFGVGTVRQPPLLHVINLNMKTVLLRPRNFPNHLCRAVQMPENFGYNKI